MSVNPNVYGTPDQWVNPFSTQEHTDRKLMFLQAYFGGGGTELKDGYGYGIDLNTPIDKSLSWCGLGTESTWSHIEYYQRKADFPLIAKDNRTITNFSWNYTNGYAPGLYLFNTSTAANAQHGDRQRFAPLATNSDTYPNRNNGIQPYSQIPVKNCVLVPFFRVAENIPNTATTTDMNIQNVVAWDYYGNTATVNHTTHPYILGIGFSPYTYNTDSSDARSAIFPNNHIHFSILDAVSLQKGLPRTKTDPSLGTMGDVYVYNIFNGGSDRARMLIFGHINNGLNDNEYLQYNSNDAYEQYGTAILPHPNAVYGPEIEVSSSSRAKWYYLEYYDGLKEWVRRQIACFGLFFTDDQTTAETGEYDDDNMLLGVLVDGVGHGDYTHGEANRLQPQWEWDTTNDSDYDPSNPPSIDPNSYNGSMGTGSLVLFGTATERYNVSAVNMALGLLPKLWDIMAQADPDEAINDYSLKTFLTNNPIDCIVSLQYLPVKNMSTGNETTIKLGNKDTKVKAYPAKTSMLYDCGNYEIYPRFGDNWIDRETKITLYLPFCGVVDLDPETYMGKTVNVEYAIDLTTGTCSAYVSFIGAGGGKVITDIANGACAIDLPVTGIQQQTLNAQLFNASESTKQLKVNNALKGFKTLMGAVSSLGGARANPLGAVSGILDSGVDLYNIFQDEKIADWNLQHTMIPTKMIGASGGLNGAMCELKPTIIFSRPTTDYNAGTYGHSVGFACCKQGVLSAFSGYTECTNVDLSGFNATATEKNMIQTALSGGVYL